MLDLLLLRWWVWVCISCLLLSKPELYAHCILHILHSPKDVVGTSLTPALQILIEQIMPEPLHCSANGYAQNRPHEVGFPLMVPPYINKYMPLVSLDELHMHSIYMEPLPFPFLDLLGLQVTSFSLIALEIPHARLSVRFGIWLLFVLVLVVESVGIVLRVSVVASLSRTVLQNWSCSI